MIAAICLSFVLAFAPAKISLNFQDKDYDKAREAYLQGNFEEAIAFYARFVNKEPKHYRAHFILGLSYRGAKQYENAIATFQRADRIQSDPPFAQYEIGKTYLAMNNHEAAVKQYLWLQGRDFQLAQYLLDLFSDELVERHKLPTTDRLSFAEKKTQTGSEKVPESQAQPDASQVSQLSATLRPTITYRERARYTEIARMNMTQGSVILAVTYSYKGEIKDIRVVRALPDGLTRNAIEAVKKIRFQPALKNGEPVNVRGRVEFNFTLY